MAKEKEKSPDINKRVLEMIESAIAIKDVVFFESVRQISGGPVFELHDPDSYQSSAYKLDHFARLWMTPSLLIVVFSKKSEVEYLLVPHANIRFARPI